MNLDRSLFCNQFKRNRFLHIQDNGFPWKLILNCVCLGNKSIADSSSSDIRLYDRSRSCSWCICRRSTFHVSSLLCETLRNFIIELLINTFLGKAVILLSCKFKTDSLGLLPTFHPCYRPGKCDPSHFEKSLALLIDFEFLTPVV